MGEEIITVSIYADIFIFVCLLLTIVFIVVIIREHKEWVHSRFGTLDQQIELSKKSNDQLQNTIKNLNKNISALYNNFLTKQNTNNQ